MRDKVDLKFVFDLRDEVKKDREVLISAHENCLQTGTLISKMIDAALQRDPKLEKNPIIQKLIYQNKKMHQEYGWHYTDTKADKDEKRLPLYE